MAEAVGLTLSTVALVSLFSTCVDIIEYFALSKNYESDYEMACVKLSLQKARLESWGDRLNVRQAFSEHADWKDKPCERDTIERSLLGIKNIFSDAEVLKNKYSLIPRKSSQLSGLLKRQGNLPSRLPHEECPSVSKRSPRPFQLFRRKTIWAIRDKQKFDHLVKELDYFITNLERVRDSVQTDKDNSVLYDRDMDIDSESGHENDQRAVSTQPSQHGMQLKPDQVGTFFNDIQDQTRGGRHAVPIEDGNNGVSKSTTGYAFAIDKQSDLALVIQGQNDVEKIPAAPENQFNQFFVKEVDGQTMTLQGFNGPNAIDNMLRTHRHIIARKDKSESPSTSRKESK